MQTEKYLNKVSGFKKITKLHRNWRKGLNADFKYPSSYKISATAIVSTIHTTLIAMIIDMIIGYDQIEQNDIIGFSPRMNGCKNCMQKLLQKLLQKLHAKTAEKTACISHQNRSSNWIKF